MPFPARGKKYGTIGVFLAITIILSTVQLYHSRPPRNQMEFRHGGHHGEGHAEHDRSLSRLISGWPSIFGGRKHHGADNPIAGKTFIMVKTGGEVMWDRLPVHFLTTLKIFPHFGLYSDDAARIEGYEVVDVLRDLPEDVLADDQLAGYRIRQQSIKENWGWSASDVSTNSRAGWDNDKFKNIPVLLHAWRTAPSHCDWFVMIDDDTYVVAETIEALIKGKKPSEPWYIGSAALISERAFAHGGSGMIISRGALSKTFGGRSEEELKDLVANYSRQALPECCGDLMAALMFKDQIGLEVNANVSVEQQRPDPFQGNRISDTELREWQWCAPLASWHHVEPWEITVLHEWERTLGFDPVARKKGALQSIIYRDLYLPFIVPIRHDWKMGAKGTKYTEETVLESPIEVGNTTLQPHTGMEDCIYACERDAQCVGWEYKDGEYCQIETERILRGRALNNLSSEWQEGQGRVTSGWLVDRIRLFRANAACDALQYNQETGEFNDDESTSEGWYFKSQPLNDGEKAEVSPPEA